MEKKPEQNPPVNETQSTQAQLEEALRARIDSVRKAADFLARVFAGTTSDGGPRAEGATPGTGGESAAQQDTGSPAAKLPAQPALPSSATAAYPGPSAASPSRASPPPPPYPPEIKHCDCGRDYTAGQWQGLVFVAFDRLGEDLAVEVRECSGCRAGLSLVVHVLPCAFARMGGLGQIEVL